MAVQWKKSIHAPLPDQIICLTTCITTTGLITVVYHLVEVINLFVESLFARGLLLKKKTLSALLADTRLTQVFLPVSAHFSYLQNRVLTSCVFFKSFRKESCGFFHLEKDGKTP